MFKKISILIIGVLFIANTISCKSSKRKNRCNTCPTWDQVDISQEEND